MQRYRILARVDVSHDYFADGDARGLRFTPQADTATFLKRFDMLLRSDSRSLVVSVEESKLPGIWSERQEGEAIRSLCFDVHSVDPSSAYYTDVADTGESSAEEGGIRPVPLLEPRAQLSPPLAIMGLPLLSSPDIGFDDWTKEQSHYRLRLISRRTIWKYLLVGEWRGRTLSIVDQRGEVQFTPPQAERLPDGQTVLVARSTVPIALQERPTQRFQLRDVTEAPERVLISRLPGAQPQRLWREMLGGQPTTVSEIFVHS
ncbi:hypothetical protein [Dyella sp.]|uniref:hypothetical protein n=1 Tax=Dyella sp. TaxID=1869338 RepID=UPI002ED0C7B3